MARSMVIVCSATLMAFPPGVFMTSTPLRVAASRSTLSTPTPARPMTRRALGFVHQLGRHLRRAADEQGVCVANFFFDLPFVLGRFTTFQEGSAFRIPTTLSSTLSAIRIFIVLSRFSVPSQFSGPRVKSLLVTKSKAFNTEGTENTEKYKSTANVEEP